MKLPYNDQLEIWKRRRVSMWRSYVNGERMVDIARRLDIARSAVIKSIKKVKDRKEYEEFAHETENPYPTQEAS